MQLNRLREGGRIDRTKPLTFTFNGKQMEGYRGDTLASALLANRIHLVGRSFKYHRRRGIIGAGAEEPNALMQIGVGAGTIPNCRATQVELYDGLSASTPNASPSLDFDIYGINNYLSRFLPAGFYYKTFMWPKTFWKKYEHHIRRASGIGTCPSAPDPDRYEKRNAHFDVVIIGGGPSGLMAALEAGRRGAEVLLADDQHEFGGRLLASHDAISGVPAVEWIDAIVSELKSLPNVHLLSRTTVFGYYDSNFLAMIEKVSDDSAFADGSLPRQRLWTVRARQVVIAAGSFERPFVFHNNDRPGVMLASAVSAYVNRFAVVPGHRSVLFANNNYAYKTALDLLQAGSSVLAVVDARQSPPENDLTRRLRESGTELLRSHVVFNTRGHNSVTAVEVGQITADGAFVAGSDRWIECDLLAVSGGWNPALDMHCQSGARATYDESKACFVPGKSVQAERSAGSCNGSFALSLCLAEGIAAGAAASQAAGFGPSGAVTELPAIEESEPEQVRPIWLVPSKFANGRGPKQFVDFQNDTSAADLRLAVCENYRSIEHVKRYTLLGFGTDQGKISNVNGIGIVAQYLGKDINSVGTTTFRPAYSPVTFGTLAGRDVGRLFDAVRKTPMHEWHVAAGAEFENVGQWKRPWYYPQRGESLEAAVRRECLATQRSIGILDYSTLGKIEVTGPDATAFLNMLYTNDKGRLPVGRCNYGFLLREDGSILDDGVTSRLGENHYYLTTTTGGAARVMAWMEQWLQTEWPHLKLYLTSVTDQWANISINGPNSRNLISEVCSDIDFRSDAFPMMSFREGTVAGVPARVFRVSFSGELAYEISVPASYGRSIWELLMSHGEKYEITPYGTETMHVLRADKGYVIVGQDTDGSVTPVDLGMNWILAKDKDFIGKRSLSRKAMKTPGRKQLVGLLSEDPNEVLPEGSQIVEHEPIAIPMPMLGHISSSYFSARLGCSIALGLVKDGRKRLGQTVFVDRMNGTAAKMKVVKPIFYDAEGVLQNA